MFDRLKQVLVESFIGAVALGYLLAEIVLSLVRVFDSPAAVWASRNLYREIAPNTGTFTTTSLLQSTVPPAVAFVLLLLLWYLLLRWLYFTPVKKDVMRNLEHTNQV